MKSKGGRLKRVDWVLGTVTKLLVLVLVDSICSAKQSDIEPGDSPPLLRATSLLQAPPSAALDSKSLAGKVVVLEFWATWCGPCVQAIPHLNELAEKFKDKGVQFIAITSENQDTIKTFLKKRPIEAWIALDADRSMHDAYGVAALPQTIVIGRDGKIADITDPYGITEARLNELLIAKNTASTGPHIRRTGGAGLEIQKRMDQLSGAEAAGSPIFQILIRRASETNSEYGFGAKRRGWACVGATIREVLPRAFGPVPDRIILETALPEGRYDILINTRGASPAASEACFREALRCAFGLTGKRVTVETNVLALKIDQLKGLGLPASTSTSYALRSAPGELSGTYVALSDLARALERTLNIPVIDESGSTNRFDFRLTWNSLPKEESQQDLIKTLRQEFGLILEETRRPVEMWKIGNSSNQTALKSSSDHGYEASN